MPPRPDKKIKMKLRKVNLEEREEIFRDYYEKARSKKDQVALEAMDKKSPLRAIAMEQLKKSQNRLAQMSNPGQMKVTIKRRNSQQPTAENSNNYEQESDSPAKVPTPLANFLAGHL